MTEVTVSPLPERGRSPWWGRALIAVVFLSGGVLGSIGGAYFVHQRITSLLHHPEQVPDRVLPIMRSRLRLTDEQFTRVDAIVRRHHATLESLRREVAPRVGQELQAMRDEVSTVLDTDQQARWTAWCDFIRSHLELDDRR